MNFGSLTIAQFNPFLFSAIFLVLAIFLYHKSSRLGLGLLFIGSLILGYFFANLDPFLHLWDEQFHALVAKNLSNDFLKPTLYSNPPLDYDFKNWSANHIWLHKQPLFLWQIALSIKVFGTTALAVRIPSILMHSIMIFFIYRIGKITVHKNVGFYTAFLFTVAYFPLELVAGNFSTDHNDVAFLFYVTGSFWAWFEYQRSSNKYWLILIGLFSGGAVLVKWLMGLLVFVIWGIIEVIQSIRKQNSWKSYIPIAISGFISLFVFLPWQIFIHLKYPTESTYEMQLNASHFLHPVEGHEETMWYYFHDGFKAIYGQGDLVFYFVLAGAIILVAKLKELKHQLFIALSIVFVYAFYTIAKTKMVSFPVIVTPFLFMGIAHLIHLLISFIQKKTNRLIIPQILASLIIAYFGYLLVDLAKVEERHATKYKDYSDQNRIRNLVENQFISSLSTQLEDDNYVIFNSNISIHGETPVMFHTNYTAYNFIPLEGHIDIIRAAGKKIAVVDLGELPTYITEDKDIQILKVDGIGLLQEDYRSHLSDPISKQIIADN